MSDLISRAAAIDALQKEIDKGIPPFDDVMGSIRCGVRLARNIIEDLPSALGYKHEKSAQQWIPCSERLPEVGKDVMVCYDFKGHRSVLIGVLYGDEKFHGYDAEYLTPEGCKYRKAVAWMPLPEPWEGVGR